MHVFSVAQQVLSVGQKVLSVGQQVGVLSRHVLKHWRCYKSVLSVWQQVGVPPLLSCDIRMLETVVLKDRRHDS